MGEVKSLLCIISVAFLCNKFLLFTIDWRFA